MNNHGVLLLKLYSTIQDN